MLLQRQATLLSFVGFEGLKTGVPLQWYKAKFHKEVFPWTGKKLTGTPTEQTQEL